ncbi:hypothetical protein Taro_011076 [Colocasia esculenta]|uniref:Uncharacterized protein n=1 Tax=Colocasia esculenta TaxID=4460 RepID=A0A843U5C0_COLES|nr:hypothetical protein [Colocasia esculenta]
MWHQILRNATNAKFKQKMPRVSLGKANEANPRKKKYKIKVEEQSQERQAFPTKDQTQVAGQSPEKANPSTRNVAPNLEECQKCKVQKDIARTYWSEKPSRAQDKNARNAASKGRSPKRSL